MRLIKKGLIEDLPIKEDNIMKKYIHTLNEEIGRMKSLFTEERMFGNLIEEIETYEGDTESPVEGEESESAKPSCCTSCNCWADCGGSSYFNGTNGRPKIDVSKSDTYFSVTYEGPFSGYLVKHGKCGAGDSVHQLCNVLTYEINKYLKGKKLKPNINNIDFEKEGSKFTIGVPLKSTEKSYKLERRGRWNGGEAGKQEVISAYSDRSGYEGPVRYSSGGIIEFFVTFYE
jgi:hypothetical protein